MHSSVSALAALQRGGGGSAGGAVDAALRGARAAAATRFSAIADEWRTLATSTSSSSRSDESQEASCRSSSSSGSGEEEGHKRHRALSALLREAQVAEASMSKFFRTQQLLSRGRPDTAYFAEQEQAQLAAVQELMPRYRARPSLLLTAAKAAGVGAGALAAAAPRGLRDALVGGLQDALTEAYNEQLGELRRQGLSDGAPEIRRLLLALRDLERAPDGAPVPPDVLALQRAESLGDVGVAGLVGAAAKAAALLMLSASKRI